MTLCVHCVRFVLYMLEKLNILIYMRRKLRSKQLVSVYVCVRVSVTLRRIFLRKKTGQFSFWHSLFYFFCFASKTEHSRE